MRKTQSFLLLCLLTAPVLAQGADLSQDQVAKTWPYPEKVLKVYAANGTLVKNGKTVKIADVVTQVESTQKCVAYRAYFTQKTGLWSYVSDEGGNGASCSSLRAEESKESKKMAANDAPQEKKLNKQTGEPLDDADQAFSKEKNFY